MPDNINYSEQLKTDPSRANIDFVSYIAGNDKTAFRLLFELIYTAPHPINQRAAGVIETISRTCPELISPYIDRMTDTFRNFDVDGVKRNFSKIFTRTSFSDDQKAKMINLCFDLVQDKKESIAVRVFSMQVLYNISVSIPEIKHELAIIIESEMQLGSAAWKSRGTQLLKKIYSDKG
ncbi:MAG: hypothetical protein U9R19_06075 [Bacteroidota bacterium]|nr:hypothetical protein [Bacteroidota bacterium]